MSEALVYPACCTDCPCPATPAVTPAATGVSSFTIVETVEDGRAFNPLTLILPAILHTQGGLAPGDGLGKAFWYNAASFAVDDGTEFTVVIRPNTIDAGLSGRWEQTSLG